VSSVKDRQIDGRTDGRDILYAVRYADASRGKMTKKKNAEFAGLLEWK